MARLALNGRYLRIGWVLTLTLFLVLLAAFARTALAATNFIYTIPGDPTSGTVSCDPYNQTCELSPGATIGTPGWAYRNWNDAYWNSWVLSHGEVAYVDTNGSWFDSATAVTKAEEQAGYIHQGQSAYAKAICHNANNFSDGTATNIFECITTKP
jgi:hypothetical protein